MKILINVTYFVCLLLLSQNAAFGQDVFKLDKARFDLAVKADSKKVTATALNPNTFPEDSKIVWSGENGFIEIEQTLSSDRKTIASTFKAIKAVDSLTVNAAFGGTNIPLTINVFPEVSADTLEFTPKLTDANKTDGITITNGGQKTFSLTKKDASTIPANAISVNSDNQTTIASASIDNNLLTIKAVGAGTTVIRVKGYGKEIQNIKVNVSQGVDFNSYRNKTYPVKKGKTLNLTTIFGGDWDKLDFSPAQNPETAILSADKKTITGINLGRTYLTVSLRDDTTKDTTINISVEANAEKIVYTGLGARSLIVGERVPVSAEIEGDGERIRGVSINLTSSDASCVSVVTKPNNNFTVIGEKHGCKATLTFSVAPAAVAAGIVVPNQTIEVDTRVVGGFRPLKIRLDMLDRQTARDLFGRKAVDEYFIAKVRLFNVIGKADEDFGNSILVYSESLEVKVAVEWRQRGDKIVTNIPVWEHENDGRPKKTQNGDFIQAKDGNGQLLFSKSSNWQTLDEATATKWFNLPITVDYDNPVFKKCRIIKQDGMFVPYRPLTHEMVSNTQERRDSRSWRSRLLLTLNGVASATSFVTSIAVPGSSSDLPLGLEKFRNLLIPSYEKLFPSLNEVQRQNISSMVMRPLEEIPFGSDITRILFFPRRTINGVLLNQPNARNTELRISAISISDACAEAGIIKKATEDDTPQN